MKINTKGQSEAGSLQLLVIALVVITSSAVLLTTYINGISENYGVSVNDTQYTVFQQFDQVNETIGNFNQVFTNEDAEQSSVTDVISQMLQGGYNFIKLMFSVPAIFSGLITSMALALGLPAIVVSMINALIIVLILFAALALVMKVRA